MADGTDREAALPPASRVGRVALRVGSIDRLRPFYEDAVGLPAERAGDRLVLGPDGDTPLLVLDESPDAGARPRDAAGLFHVAIRAPDRPALGDAITRLRSADVALSGASDHLVSEALYLRDPEGNGLELYRDRPRSDWPMDADGLVGMDTQPLDVDAVEAAGSGETVGALPAGTDIGHVHLEVTDLGRAESFYRQSLGLNLRARYGASATFLAAGEYHHHVGLNTWNGRSAPAGDHRGLAWWELVVPGESTIAAVTDRLQSAGYPVETRDSGIETADPDGIALRIASGG